MMRGVLLGVSLFALLASDLPTQDILEAWMRAGDQAAEQGRWAEALAWYEKAEATPLDPGRVAFNSATARYHLATLGQLHELSAAEAGYRACLEGTRRGRALLGLGNCLLLRATASENPDAALLRAAIDQFRMAEQADTSVAEAARYNQARARLLLLQVIPRIQESQSVDPEDLSSSDDSNQQPQPPKPAGVPNGSDDGTSSGSQRVSIPNANDAPVIEEKNRPATAGSGVAHLLPNRADAAPIAAEDAQQQLSQAKQRILEEWRAYRRARLAPHTGPGADW
ncbi:MAG: hypothetical protein SNJ75_09405 [Gemmataceae bacterium]